jgi:hypothetical protein
MKHRRAIFNRNTWRDSASKAKPKFVPSKNQSDEYEKVSFDWIY